MGENNLKECFDRVDGIRTSGGVDAHIKQRVAEAAQSLDLAGNMQAHLDVAVEAIAALIVVLYATDSDGYLANIDAPTGRILIQLPWGSVGWQKWGMRQWEGRCLRKLLQDRAVQKRRYAPLFDYSADNSRWYLNHNDYPDAAAALAWLRKDGPKLTEWRSIALDHRERDMERKRKAGGK